jgi:hypothetical protein
VIKKDQEGSRRIMDYNGDFSRLLEGGELGEGEYSEECFAYDVFFGGSKGALVIAAGAKTAARVSAGGSIVSHDKESFLYDKGVLGACRLCCDTFLEVWFIEYVAVVVAIAHRDLSVHDLDGLSRESDNSFDKCVFFAFRDKDNNISSMVVVEVIVSFVDE